MDLIKPHMLSKTENNFNAYNLFAILSLINVCIQVVVLILHQVNKYMVIFVIRQYYV